MIAQLEKRIVEQNAQIMHRALVEGALGAATALALYGCLFFLLWFFGFVIESSTGLAPWLFACGLTVLFIAASFHAAWRNENPLADLEPLTDEQMLLTQLSLGSDELLYVSPRHATAGTAARLISGPANMVSAWRTARCRLPVDKVLLEAMAALLARCGEGCAVRSIADARAALTLRKLNLVKVRTQGEEDCLVLTERGQQVVRAG